MIKALIREFPVTDILDDMTEKKSEGMPTRKMRWMH